MKKFFRNTLITAVAAGISVGGFTLLTQQKTLAAAQVATVTATKQGTAEHKKEAITPDAAKKLLVDGNQRFVKMQLGKKDLSTKKRAELTKGQSPFAVIVGCSDSRVSPEIAFDQGLGDVFVVRTAGNVVAPLEIGSVEYAVEHLHSPLIVVLGHEKCGAVKASLEGETESPNINAIIKEIKPSVDKVKAQKVKEAELADKVENENVRHSIVKLNQSKVIQKLVKEGKVKIVGAKYKLATGQVEFLK